MIYFNIYLLLSVTQKALQST